MESKTSSPVSHRMALLSYLMVSRHLGAADPPFGPFGPADRHPSSLGQYLARGVNGGFGNAGVAAADAKVQRRPRTELIKAISNGAVDLLDW